MSQSDRRGAPQPRETPQISISNSSPSGEDVAKRQKGGATTQRDAPKKPPSTKKQQKTCFSRRSGNILANLPKRIAKDAKQNSTPGATSITDKRNTPKGVANVETLQKAEQRFHARRAHDRRRDHRHPRRHRHPGVLALYQELQGG